MKTTLLGFVLSGLVSTHGVYADEPPAFSRVESDTTSATLQVTFPTSFYNRADDVLSAALEEFPTRFAHLHLNTLGRKLHSTLLYLDGITMAEAKRMAEILANVRPEILDRYQLRGEFKVFDPRELDLVRVGTQSVFLALRPHEEFRGWMTRFYRFCQEALPKYLDRHKAYRGLGEEVFDESRFHISLVQWGAKKGIPLSEADAAEVEREMRALFQEKIGEYRAREGRYPPSVTFSLGENPLQLVSPPVSLAHSPMEIFTARSGPVSVGERGFELSHVFRWRTTKDGADPNRGRDVLEIDMTNVVGRRGSWAPSPREFTPVQLDRFDARLDPRVRETYVQTRSGQSESLLPAHAGKGASFVVSETHPMLAPERARDIFEQARTMGFESIGSRGEGFPIYGLALYASAVRADVANPGDYDLLYNSWLKVPDSVQTREEAYDYAWGRFATTLREHLVHLVETGRISILEMRMGSNATMAGVLHPTISDYLSNPYLTETNVLNGHFVDTTGRSWSFEELMRLGDFLKGKVDLFLENGSRVPLSLQFHLGFTWKGQTFDLHANALKGVPPLMRTAVYDGPNSFAIASILSRPYQLTTLGKGSILARSFRDINGLAYKYGESEIFWSTKLLKKVYNMFFLLRQSALDLDLVFMEQLGQIVSPLEAARLPDDVLTELTRSIREAINQPELHPLNVLRRNLNDLYEFHERRQEFSPASMGIRIGEIESMLFREGVVDHIREGASVYELGGFSGEEWVRNLEEFLAVHQRLKEAGTHVERNAIIQEASVYQALKRFEKTLYELEASITVLPNRAAAISPENLRILGGVVKVFPSLYVAYEVRRSQKNSTQLAELRDLMGVTPLQLTTWMGADAVSKIRGGGFGRCSTLYAF